MQLGFPITATRSIRARTQVVVPPATAPVISELPILSGDPRVGEVLSASAAPVSGNPVPTRSWQWLRNGSDIPGATDAAYTLTSADEGAAIAVRQIESNTEGTAEALSSPTAIILPVLAGPAVAPVLSLDALTPGSGGAPSTIQVSYSYSGTDVVDLYFATGASGFAITEAQMVAQSGGGAVEFATEPGYVGAQFDLTGLTDDTVTELVAVAVERNNGGSSGIQRFALSGIHFTQPTLTGAEVGLVDASTLRVAFDENLFGTTSTDDWTVSGRTVTGVTFTPGTATIDLALGTPVASGDVVALGYSGIALTDSHGNALAAFAGTAVTNNVPAAASLAHLNSYTDTAFFGAASSGPVFAGAFPDAGTYLVAVTYIKRELAADAYVNVTGVVTAATELANAATEQGAKFYLVTTDGAGDLNIRNSASSTQVQGLAIHVWHATGLTTTGVISNSVYGQGAQHPPSVSLSAVPDGYFMAAAYLDGTRNATDVTWTAGLSRDAFGNFSAANHTYSAASGVKTGTGDQIITATNTGGKGGEFVLMAIALESSV